MSGLYRTGGLLYKREYAVNDFISVKIPTVGEILSREREYYEDVAMIVSTPSDMIAQLDGAGIDFTSIGEWDLFCLLFRELRERDLSMIFGELSLSGFEFAVSRQNGNTVLVDSSSGAVIDRAIHDKICRVLRQILGLTKNTKRPGNEEAKAFMIERAKKKLKRKGKQTRSALEDMIVALVNTAEFPYDYNSVHDLTICQFNASLHQIIRKVRFDNLMIGCYAGTVDAKGLDQDEMTWITI